MAIDNPFKREYEVVLPKLCPTKISDTREMRRRREEERLRKSFEVRKTKVVVPV